jgi:hypothetical protein
MKRWFYTLGLAGLIAVLLIPLMGFSSNAEGQKILKPNQIMLESGGIGVPGFEKPRDGIISGTAGCVPDLHEYDKTAEFGHIVFSAGVKKMRNQEQAEKNPELKIFVEISSEGKIVGEFPFVLHETPDPNTEKPFWVSAIYFEEAYTGANVIDLPTGDYNYKFIAKDKNDKVLDVWVPKNHKFTITD